MRVAAQPLTSEQFAPFGQVVSAGGAGKSANQGTAVRFDWIASLASSRAEAKANVAVFRSVPKALPFAVKLLERHPCSTQMFIPMKCERFLVVVCPNAADGMPALDGLRAFLCGPGQGFNYAAGVWHHPIIALDAAAEFMMLAYEDGTPRDCEEWPVPSEITVVA